MSAPKLFISYSWSSQEYEKRVVALAEELTSMGIEVILDKWDLKEGQDKYQFMEKMVTDPDIKKVAILCDRVYAAKADERKGGVGTETQIISREVYEKVEQNKFVAVVMERDDEGREHLPTYYKSKIYIDLSSAETYSEDFEQLVRWVYDKPRHVKPPLGTRPAFLDEEPALSLGTAPILRRALHAIKNGLPYAGGAFDEYSELFLRNLERFRLERGGNDFDDRCLANIEQTLPVRNEVVQLITAVAQYLPTAEFVTKVHRLLEGLTPYLYHPPGHSGC